VPCQQQIKQIDNKPKVLFATAYYLNYDVFTGYFPTKDENNEIDKILGDSGGRFIRKPVNINELLQRTKSEIPSSTVRSLFLFPDDQEVLPYSRVNRYSKI
jgi:hypothetical protein